MLESDAIKILEDNWRESFTIPTAKLYPFQWMWDSGFVALGRAAQDIDKAVSEIYAMFSGQWENGMLPHIIFHSENETTYFPNFDFWNCNVNPGAPVSPKTSGITQPAVFGFVMEDIWRSHHQDPKVKKMIEDLLPKLIHYHRFLYEYRDPFNEGLFFIFHPWESGRDNSPIWDEAINRINIDKSQLPNYTRRDTQIADASERPTSDQYDKYVYLLELGKRHLYDGKGIAEESPFLIQDCMMNAILIRSNESILRLGEEFGVDTSYIKEKNALSKAHFLTKLWNEELKTFVCFDLVSNEQIKHKEIGGFIAMFAGLANEEQVGHMVAYLEELHQRGYFLCPSFDVDSPLFDSKRYWRGPIWPQMNWMIHKGLLHYGQKELAEIVKSDLISLVTHLGFYEYFESEKTKVRSLTQGYGGGNFSWTASSILHLLTTE